MDATTDECWLPIPGYEGFYKVSDHGRVRSLERRVIRQSGGTYRVRPRILKPASDNGRLLVNLHGPDGRNASRKVHQLVLEAFVGPRPEGFECCHRDDDHANNTLHNLRWATHADNMQDCIRNGGNSRQIRTHCPRSHPLEAPNLVPSELRARGRKCLACSRAMSMAATRIREGEIAADEVDMQALADTYYAEIVDTDGRARIRPNWIRHDLPLPRLTR